MVREIFINIKRSDTDMSKAMIITLSFVLILAFAGCSPKETSSNTVPASDSAQTEAPSTSVAPQAPAAKADPYQEYRDLEITPSGDGKCFLSPCDCNCYPIPNVPLNAKKPTCATDCKNIYGITGCRFTNYQCYTLP